MARFSDEALASLREELQKHAASAPIGEPMRVATGVMQTLLEMAAIANLRTERPRVPRVPPDTIYVQWSPVAGALVSLKPFAILDGARAQYRRVALGDFVSERQRRDWDDVTSVGAPDDAGDPDD